MPVVMTADIAARQAMDQYKDLFNDPEVADKAAAAAFVVAYLQANSAVIAATTAQLQLEASNSTTTFLKKS